MKRVSSVLLCILCLMCFVPWAAHGKSEEEYQQEIRALQQRNTQLENTLEHVSADLQQAAKEVKLLQQQVAQMSKHAEENAKEVKDSREAMKQLKSQMKGLLEQQGDKGSTDKKKLEEQLTKALKQTHQLEKEAKTAAEAHKQLQREKEHLQKTVAALEKEVKKQSENTISEAHVTQLQHERDALAEELNKQKQLYKANLSLLHERDQELAQVKQQLQARAQPQKAEEDASRDRIAELETTLTNINARLLKVSEEKARLEEQLAVPSSDHAQSRIRELEQQIALLQNMLSEQQEGTAQRISATQQQEANIAQLEAELTDANVKIVQLAQQNAALEAQVGSQHAAQAELQAKSAEIARLEGELRKAADYINTRNAELAALQQQHAELSAKLAALQTTNTELQGQLSQKSGTLQTQLSEVDQLRAQVRTLEAQASLNQSLQTSLQETQQQTSTYQQQISQLQSALQDAQQQNVTFQADIASLKHQLDIQGSVPEEAKKRIQEITLELQETKAQLNRQQRIQQEYPALQEDVISLRDQVARLTQEQQQRMLLDAQLRELQLAFEQAQKELDVVATQHIELKNELKRKESVYQTRGEKFEEIMERNRLLEQKYAEGQQDVALKEKLLQQALTEKALLEKTLDERGASGDGLQAKLKEAEALNAVLREQLQALHGSIEQSQDSSSQAVNALQAKLQEAEARNAILQQQLQLAQETQRQAPAPTTDAMAPHVAALEQKILQEQTLRQQTASNLQQALQRADTLQEQVVRLQVQVKEQRQTAPPVQAVPLASQQQHVGTPLQALFPQSLAQQTSGSVISILDWSPDKRNVAYVETTNQQEGLWIFDVNAKRSTQITAWQRGAGTSSTTRMAWAFDSAHFLFATGVPGHYALYVGNTEAWIGNPIQVHDQALDFAWSPKQLQFAYFSGQQLLIQNIRGEALPIQIGHEAGLEGTSLAWAPDGSKIALCIKRDGSFDLFLLLFPNNTPLLQPLVASSSDNLQPSWSPDGQHLAFYVKSGQYDTKVAVTPVDKSRAPFIVGHNASLPSRGGPRWGSSANVLYMGEENLSVLRNSIYQVNITTGQRSTAPISMLFAQ